MVRQTAATIVLEIVGGLLLLVLVAAGFLALRLSQGPIELRFLKDDVETGLARARGGRPVELGQVFLEWSKEHRRLVVAADRIVMRNQAGDEMAKAEHAEFALTGASLLSGKPEIQELEMRDGYVLVDRLSPTRWTIAGDPLPEFKFGPPPTSLAGWLERANTVLPSLLVALSEAEKKFELRRVSLENFEVRVRAEDSSPILTLEGARAELARTREGVLLNVAGNGKGLGLPAGLGASLESSVGGQKLHANFAVADWPLADLAGRFKLATGKIEGLPADADLSFDVDRAGGIETVTFNAAAGAGKLPFGTEGLPVKDLTLVATYAAASDALVIDAKTTDAGPMGGGFVMTLRNTLKAQGPRPFELVSPAMTVDLTPRFEAPFAVSAVKATGEIDLVTRAFSKLDLAFAAGGANVTVKGDLAPVSARKEKEPPVIGAVDVTAEGQIDGNMVAAFWPVQLGSGARNFLKTRIETAELSELKGRIDLKRDSFATGFLRDEDLDVTFTARKARVKFLADMPPVDNATGRGRLTGNSFKMIIEDGTFSGWRLDDGVVDFPVLNPKGQEFRVFAQGQGPIDDVVRTLSQSRFKIKFDPTRLSGDAVGTFELFQPALSNVPADQIRFSAIAQTKNAGLKAAAFDLDMTDGNAKVDVTQKGMSISGYGNLGPSPVQFTWRDDFKNGNAPSQLTATSVMKPDMLNRFGLLGRAYLSGEAPMDIQAQIGADRVQSADIAIDLTDTRLDISEVGWVKPKGVNGKASVRYTRSGDAATSKVLFTSDTGRLDGDFTLGSDQKLLAATLRRAYVKNKADVNGEVRRAANGQMNVALKGTYLDISGMFPGVGGAAASKSTTPSDGRKRSATSITAKIDTLVLRPGLDMRSADVSLFNGTKGLERFSAKGKSDDGSPLEASFDATGAVASTLRVKGGNAGFLAMAFLDADFIEGGALDLVGTLPKNGSPSKFTVVITDARLRNAPFLTQVLSLASLRGLADTLSGEGVLFSRIEIPMTVSGGRYIVTGGKAQGPALGLTANGYLETKTDKIEVDGVLVPSFGMNSALGAVPIIGDLVVGRDGEGIFSLTYGVKGTLKKANVSVNPLSALAPGVIRRIFENPSDTSIPEAKTRPPTEPIPSELPPIPDE